MSGNHSNYPSLRGSFTAEAISLIMGETASQKDARSDVVTKEGVA